MKEYREKKRGIGGRVKELRRRKSEGVKRGEVMRCWQRMMSKMIWKKREKSYRIL